MKPKATNGVTSNGNTANNDNNNLVKVRWMHAC